MRFPDHSDLGVITIEGVGDFRVSMDRVTLAPRPALDTALREALENDVLPWLDADRGVTRDDVVRRLRKVLAWTALEADHA